MTTTDRHPMAELLSAMRDPDNATLSDNELAAKAVRAMGVDFDPQRTYAPPVLAAFHYDLGEEKHRDRHLHLHKALDELFGDFVSHNTTMIEFMRCPISVLIAWSFLQTQQPDPLPQSYIAKPVDNSGGDHADPA